MSFRNVGDDFVSEVEAVVSEGNCTGCGACSIISDRIDMRLDSEGFSRPISIPGLNVDSDVSSADSLSSFCPGVLVERPDDDRPKAHPELGSYTSVWRGWASDEDIRYRGSSGGVLTALSEWLLSSKKVDQVAASGASDSAPTHTVSKLLDSTAEVRKSAGSRYAPVPGLASLKQSHGGRLAVVAKPCEISALRGLVTRGAVFADDLPVTLSFFCAGTPSQFATDDLVLRLGVEDDAVSNLSYRGNGWPGKFRIADAAGKRLGDLSYEESWGEALGRSLQWRCKICVDGSGEHADISVGDLWSMDAKGYPMFEESDGQSAVIARTSRGHDLLLEAARNGVVQLEAIDMDDVARSQPYQLSRKRSLPGRLMGRRLAGLKVPKYVGFELVATAIRHPLANIRAVVGAFLRSRVAGRSL